MALFQVFPYWDEDHTHAMAIDTFAKSSILPSPAQAHLLERPFCLSPRVPALKSAFSLHLSVTFAGTFMFCPGAALKQIFGILRAVVRDVPCSLHASSHRWIETKTTSFMRLSSTI